MKQHNVRILFSLLFFALCAGTIHSSSTSTSSSSTPKTEEQIKTDLDAKAKTGSMKVRDIPGMNEITLPKSVKKFFDDLSITDPVLTQVNLGVKLTGHTKVNGTLMDITATVLVGVGKITSDSISPAVKASLGVMLPKTYKFSSLDPMLAAVDLFQFDRVAFLLSTYGYRDMDWNVAVAPGVNIVGSATFDKDSSVAKVVPGINKLIVAGNLTPALIRSSITGIWPVALKLSDDVTTTDLTIGVEVSQTKTPIYVIETGLLVTVPDQKEPLNFRSAFNIGMEDVRIEGAMDGMWEDPLGVKGLSIGNMGVEGTLSYAGLLTGIGLRGRIALGSKSIDLAGVAKIGDDAVFGAVALAGEINNFYLNDIVAVTAQVMTGASGKKVKITNALPNLGFDNVKIYIVPMPTEIAEKMYLQGLTVAGTLSLGITKVVVDTHISDAGAQAMSTMKKIDWGPIVITGAGLDKQEGTKDDGPIFNMQIDGTKQEIYIDGLVALTLFGETVSSEEHLSLNSKGFAYATSLDLWAYKWDLETTINWPKFDNVGIKAHMAQTGLSDFAKVLRDAADAVVLSKSDIQKALDKLQDELDDVNAKIKKKKKKCGNDPISKWTHADACLEYRALQLERDGIKASMTIVKKAGAWGSKQLASVTNALATLADKAFNVQEMSFEGNAKDLTSAKLPKVKVKGVFLGKNFNETMQLDLSDLADAADKIMDKVKDLFK